MSVVRVSLCLYSCGVCACVRVCVCVCVCLTAVAGVCARRCQQIVNTRRARAFP